MKSHKWRAIRNSLAKQARSECNKLMKEIDLARYTIRCSWSTTADSLYIRVIEKKDMWFD